MTTAHDIVLLALLLVTTWGVIRLRNLVAAVILLGLYSLLMAVVWVLLDAVDVAFTEAAVGAGITTILMLAAVVLVGREEKPPAGRRVIPQVLPMIIVGAMGAALLYGSADMPPFGAADNPVHGHVAPRYIEDSPEEIGIPNMVTSVLASYRGYDTLGETTVIFTAGIGVLLLLSARRRRDDTSTRRRSGDGEDGSTRRRSGDGEDGE